MAEKNKGNDLCARWPAVALTFPENAETIKATMRVPPLLVVKRFPASYRRVKFLFAISTEINVDASGFTKIKCLISSAK